MNSLYNQIGRDNSDIGMLHQKLNQLKQTFKGDPTEQIQQLLNSGKVTQSQYNQAVRRAQDIMRLMR